MQRLESRQRHDDAIVVRVLSSTEHRLDLLYRADDFEQTALDVDLFAQRILVTEQFSLGFVADYYHWRVMFVVEVAEPSAAGHRQVEHILGRSHVAFDDGIPGLLILIFDRIATDAQFWAKDSQTRRDCLDVGQVAHGQRVVVGEFLAAAHFIGHAAKCEEVQMEYKDDVRSDAGNELANVVIEPATDRRHADHDGHADHDSQHRQPRTQLVAVNRVGRHVDDFAELAFSKHNYRLPVGAWVQRPTHILMIRSDQ